MLDATPATLGPGTIDWNATLYRTLLSPADTGGAMSIVDSLSPAGSGPPRHIPLHMFPDKENKATSNALSLIHTILDTDIYSNFR